MEEGIHLTDIKEYEYMFSELVTPKEIEIGEGEGFEYLDDFDYSIWLDKMEDRINKDYKN